MSDTIALLSSIELIRERPGTYIGDNDQLGLDTIVREIIDNAVDEYPNFPDQTKPIRVTLEPGNIVSVRDYGRGISPYPSEKVKGQIGLHPDRSRRKTAAEPGTEQEPVCWRLKWNRSLCHQRHV